MSTANETARAEIHALKARYFRLMDTKDWAGYAELFLPDTVFNASEAFRDPDDATDPQGLAAVQSAPVIGTEAIVDYVRHGLHAGVRSAHQGFMPEIEILSDQSARGIWAMEDRVWLPDGPIALMHGWGHYHETYSRRDGRWHIQTLKIARLRVALTRR